MLFVDLYNTNCCSSPHRVVSLAPSALSSLSDSSPPAFGLITEKRTVPSRVSPLTGWTMLSHSHTQDKEDVNTKIDGPRSGLGPSLLIFFHSPTLFRKILSQCCHVQFSYMQSRY